MNSSTVLTVWEDEKLVGLTRVLDDTEMLAQVHYVLVHPDYQGMGIGGSVLFSAKRAGSEKTGGKENQYFTAAVIGSVILSVLAWIGIIVFERPVLTFFGADSSLLLMAQKKEIGSGKPFGWHCGRRHVSGYSGRCSVCRVRIFI